MITITKRWRRGMAAVALGLQASLAFAQASVLEPHQARIASLSKQGQHDQVLALLQSLLAEQPAGTSAGTADILIAQTLAYNQLRQGRLGMETARQAWQMRTELWGATDLRTLEALEYHLRACGTAAATAAAGCLPLAAEAVRWNETTGRPKLVARALHTQITLAHQASQLPLAMTLMDRLLEVLQSDPAVDAEDLIRIQRNKAVLLQNGGQYLEALKELDLLQQLRAELLVRFPAQRLMTMVRRARVLDSLGRHAEAGQQWEAALALCRANPDPAGAACFEPRVGLGGNQLRSGRTGQAVGTLRAVAAEAAQRPLIAGDNVPMEGRYLLALALRQAGLHAESLELLRGLLDHQTRGFGEQHPDYATYLQAYATGLQLAGQPEESRRQFERALSIGVRLRSAEHPQVLVYQLNAWAAAARAGQAPAADALEVLAGKLLKALGAEHAATRSAQHQLAAARLREGQAGLAVPQAREAAQGRERLLGAAHPDSLQSQALLAQALEAAGEPQQALQVLDAMVAPLHSWRRAMAGLGPTAQRQSLQDLQAAMVQRAALLAARGDLDAAFLAVEGYKAQGLLLELARERGLQAAMPSAELNDQLLELAQRRHALEALLAATRHAQQREALTVELLGLHERYEVLLQQAARQSPRLAALLQPPLPRPQDLRRLPRNTALLHYLRGPDEQWHALVLRPDRQPRWFALGRWAGHQAEVEQLRAWGARPLHQGVAPGEPAALRQALGERLLAPLAGALAGVQSLRISPDGALGTLPWDTLLVAGKPALARWQLSQAASLAALQMPAPLERERASRDMLALGASQGWQQDDEQWPPLPHAEQEASKVAALFPRTGSRALLGAQASEQAVRELARQGELARYRQLHIAAHGRFDPASGPALLLGRTGDSPEQDGVMGVADWLGLTLGSRLTVLSACDTARGRLLDGEGLTGFAYALQLAGNRDLLATLWPVSDAAAAAFVPAFLARVKQGQHPAAALAATKRAFAAAADPRLSLPRSWAGFVLVEGA